MSGKFAGLKPSEMEIPPDLLQVVEGFGGGGRTRTYDLRIMRCTFRRAATWIQSFTFGPSHLIRAGILSFGS